MINFGGKKDEGDKNQGISEAMRSMSDQIGRQAQEIKRLQRRSKLHSRMLLLPKRCVRRWPMLKHVWRRWKLS